jgi:hypothetical protein
MTHKFCNGTTIKFKPKYQTTTECDECGAIHKLDKPILLNKPDFHKGPLEKDKCLACGKQDHEIGMLVVMKNLEQRTIKYITENFDKQSKFFDYLEKKTKT